MTFSERLRCCPLLPAGVECISLTCWWMPIRVSSAWWNSELCRRSLRTDWTGISRRYQRPCRHQGHEQKKLSALMFIVQTRRINAVFAGLPACSITGCSPFSRCLPTLVIGKRRHGFLSCNGITDCQYSSTLFTCCAPWSTGVWLVILQLAHLSITNQFPYASCRLEAQSYIGYAASFSSLFPEEGYITRPAWRLIVLRDSPRSLTQSPC